MKPKRVLVHDKMQRGYVYWRTKPIWRDFRPGFTPELSPKQAGSNGTAVTTRVDAIPTTFVSRTKSQLYSRAVEVFYCGQCETLLQAQVRK